MSIKANRSIVSTLGIPALLLIIWLGGIPFSILMSAVCLFALAEFYLLTQKKNLSPVWSIGMISALLIVAFYHFQPKVEPFIIYSIIIGLTIGLLYIELFRQEPNPTENVAVTFSGVLYIPLLLGTLIGIRAIDADLSTRFTFSLFISIWICDSAAYLAGRKWGKAKIAEKVSPNKTIVGMVAGIISSFIIYIIFNETGFIGIDLNIKQIIVFSLITGVFGQTGDLIESLFKRDAKMKDSGVILLGHGGVLDRFDSLIIASPMVYIYLNIII